MPGFHMEACSCKWWSCHVELHWADWPALLLLPIKGGDHRPWSRAKVRLLGEGRHQEVCPRHGDHRISSLLGGWDKQPAQRHHTACRLAGADAADADRHWLQLHSHPCTILARLLRVPRSKCYIILQRLQHLRFLVIYWSQALDRAWLYTMLDVRASSCRFRYLLANCGLRPLRWPAHFNGSVDGYDSGVRWCDDQKVWISRSGDLEVGIVQ
mmetsp:Transcript_9101/g.15034  ORF Transcript_9101/g.15034 Transcript_9101/m.15034 type:complete len:212 (+) Transcript_9101:272-907(+)